MKKCMKILVAGYICMAAIGTIPVCASAKSANETPIATAAKSDFENIAVSQVTGYVNVRTEPNTSSSVVGKIYNNCAATILETVVGEGGSWYKIQSGSVTGYIKAQYFITGDAAETLAQQIGKEFATINTSTLRLRERPDLTSNTLTMLTQGAEYVVLGEEGDFFKVDIDNDLVGYVAKSYIKTTIRFDQAVSLEEEAAKRQDELQRKRDADAAMAALDEVKRVETKSDGNAAAGTSAQTSPAAGSQTGETVGHIAPNPEQASDSTVAAPTTAASSTTVASGNSGGGSGITSIGPGQGQSQGSAAVSSAARTAIVAYSKQFLGNPYLFGGTSLTNGADCSGFTQAIFGNFDIAIGRSSRDQADKGRTISVDAIQPGDLLFYASGDYINHVALYIGGGQVIHASNSTTGIIISPYNYRTPCKAVTFLD